MDTRKTIDAYTQFSGTLAPLLGRMLHAAGGESWVFTTVDLPAVSASAEGLPASQAGEAEDEHVAIAIRFEGALSGHCVLRLSTAHAALVCGSESAAAKLLLIQLVQGICEPFAAALSAHYGSVRVHYVEDPLLEQEATLVARLAARPAGASEAGVTDPAETQADLPDTLPEDEPLGIYLDLLADGELQRGLTRLARVAAAAEASGITSGNLGLVMDVELNVTLRFGQRQLSLREVMELASGSVVELDREVDEPVDLILDGRVIARGEAVIVDGNYGVRVTEVLQPVVF